MGQFVAGVNGPLGDVSHTRTVRDLGLAMCWETERQHETGHVIIAPRNGRGKYQQTQKVESHFDHNTKMT